VAVVHKMVSRANHGRDQGGNHRLGQRFLIPLKLFLKHYTLLQRSGFVITVITWFSKGNLWIQKIVNIGHSSLLVISLFNFDKKSQATKMTFNLGD